MIGMKKGQTAMEYLMTYGWAILIIIIVAAALFALGVFNPGTFTQSTATGFPGLQVQAGGWKLDSTAGTYTLIFSNIVGNRITVIGVNATLGTQTLTNNTAIPLAPNERARYDISGFTGLTAGAAFSIRAQIHYNNEDSGIGGLRSAGTTTGVTS